RARGDRARRGRGHRLRDTGEPRGPCRSGRRAARRIAERRQLPSAPADTPADRLSCRGRGGPPRGAWMRSFLQELKRRNVYRVGAMYAVSGWLLVQVATQVFPIFDVSAGVLRGIVLAIVAGFPVVLVVSWVYEVTPQGIVRTADVERGESITRQTGRKLDFVIIGVLALAVVFLVVQHYVMPGRGGAAASASIPDKSVAVLPFESLSDEKANEYFAVGIQDEILTRLAKIGALKVISRTSTQHYASAPQNLPEIARQL